MGELRNINAAIHELKQRNEHAVLATVVKVHGSTYRRPGARMLIRESGETVGLVSGGCLDSDLHEQAMAVLASGKPSLITYDSTSPDDLLWGLGLGCPGKVHVLLEPTSHESCSRMMEFLRRTTQARRRAVVATVIRSEPPKESLIGSRVLFADGSSETLGIEENEFLTDLRNDISRAFETGASEQKRYDIADSAVEVFIEVVDPPLPLLIFGAGTDAIPLCRFAGELGWDVTVIDHRPAFLDAKRFSNARCILLSDQDVMPDELVIHQDAVAVIMTHNFARDLFYLKKLLPSNLRYLGLLGPTSKSTSLLEQLREEGFHSSVEQLAKLHTPAGLDIGAETPEEIALSIIAEIRAVLAGRSGGSLRDRNAPIH